MSISVSIQNRPRRTYCNQFYDFSQSYRSNTGGDYWLPKKPFINRNLNSYEGTFQDSNETDFSWRYGNKNRRSFLNQEKKVKNKEFEWKYDNVGHLRLFNNWAKSILMLQGVSTTEGRSIIAIDLGCSKGSDIKKWHHCNVGQVYMIENDPVAMEECQKRYFNIRNKWENFYEACFIAKNIWAETLVLPELADIASCQMALHKAFESRAKVENVARNISRSLKCGGTFVASITCASKIIESLNNGNSRVSFGNSIFCVEMEKPLPENVPDFGVKFNFTVGRNKFEEYLVKVPVLESIMAKYGLVLEMNTTFLEMYFDGRKDSHQVRCMQKMGIVRYGHEKKDTYKVYLTMSDNERQAASLYEALLFKKIFK